MFPWTPPPTSRPTPPQPATTAATWPPQPPSMASTTRSPMTWPTTSPSSHPTPHPGYSIDPHQSGYPIDPHQYSIGPTHMPGTTTTLCGTFVWTTFHTTSFVGFYDLVAINYPLYTTTGLQSLTFGAVFNQNLQGVRVPSGLLDVWCCF